MLRKINQFNLLRKIGAAFVLVGLVTVCLLQQPQTVSAAVANGITVTPARLNFALSKDSPSQRVTVTVTNNYDSPVTLAAELKGIDEDAGILVPNNDVEAQLADALKLSETSIRLLPHQPHQLTVQFDNSAALTPGGHYATLVLTQQDGPSSGLSLRAAVSLAIFAVKNEGAQQSLRVDDFTTNGWLLRIPSTATLTYRNDGNVHVVPRAEVVVAKAHSLDRLRQGISNQNSVLLLPGKTWTDTVPLTGPTSVWLPTKLQVVAAYRGDGASEVQRIVRTFWYVPLIYPLVLVFGIVVFVLVRRNRRQHSLESVKHGRLSASASLMSVPSRTRTAASSAKAKLRYPRRVKTITTTAPAEPEDSAPSSTPVKTNSGKKPLKKKIKVKDEKPLITLASLEQRTTRVVPKKSGTASTSKAKQPAKTTKKATKKPKTTVKSASTKKPATKRKTPPKRPTIPPSA